MNDPPINPYAPPAHDGETLDVQPVAVEAAGALFSPMQIGVATVFGSIIGGSMLLQANYRAMHEPKAANVTIAIGLLFTAGMYVVTFNVALPFMTLGISLAAIVIFCIATSQLQGDRYTDHVLAGGRRRSSWWVVGAILAWIAVRLAIRLVIVRVRARI